MMGRREDGQGQFFYSFDLDEVVPPDHLVRQIDTVFDLSWVHKELAPYYSHTGRPSIDPVLMIRMLIVGYVFAIRSERRLCSEVQVNLAYRWFCKLGIEDNIPDHSVFCRARHERFGESDALRRVSTMPGWHRGLRLVAPLVAQRSCEPHLKAEHTGAPTNAANVKKVLATSEPSTHGSKAALNCSRETPLRQFF